MKRRFLPALLLATTACIGAPISWTAGPTAIGDENDIDLTGTLVHAGNYSMGINLLVRLVAQAAQALGSDYDIEISAHRSFGEFHGYACGDSVLFDSQSKLEILDRYLGKRRQGCPQAGVP